MERIFKKLNRFFGSKWRLGVLDMDKGRWTISSETSNIAYLRAENANGRHIILQPEPTVAPYYLLIDDLSWSMVLRHHQHIHGEWKPGRMIVETSKGNYQVWIHSSRQLSLEEKRYWLKKLHSDPGADPNNRWGRCPGFRNRKTKHRDAAGRFPLARLIWIDWKGSAKIPDKSLTHITSEIKNISLNVSQQYGYRLRNITRTMYARGDESATDFAYALALFRRGFDAQTIKERILSERSEWESHLGENRLQGYLKRTIEKARKTVFV